MQSKFFSRSILFFTLCVPVVLSAQNTFPANGNVGIGTTSPVEKLDVRGNIRLNKNILYLRDGTDVNHALAFKGDSPGFAGQLMDGPALYGWRGGLLGSTYLGTEKIALRWDENGNVGIGTTTPTEKLSVNGKVIIGDINTHYMVVTADNISVRWVGAYAGRQQILTVGDLNTGILNSPQAEFAKTIIGGGAGIIAGDIHSDYKLAVNGKLVAKSAYITLSGWGDFVFDKGYKRMNWLEKRVFFETNKHLPGVETAAEIESHGVNMSETLKHVTINVEENSLDIIDLYEKTVELTKRLEKLETENILLKKELTSANNKASK